MNSLSELRSRGLKKKHYIPESKGSRAFKAFWVDRQEGCFVTRGDGEGREVQQLGGELDVIVVSHAYAMTAWDGAKKVVLKTSDYTSPEQIVTNTIDGEQDTAENFGRRYQKVKQEVILFCLRQDGNVWEIKDSGFGDGGFLNYLTRLIEMEKTEDTVVTKLSVVEQETKRGLFWGLQCAFVRDVAENKVQNIIEAHHKANEWMKSQSVNNAAAVAPEATDGRILPTSHEGPAQQVSQSPTTPPPGPAPVLNEGDIPF